VKQDIYQPSLLLWQVNPILIYDVRPRLDVLVWYTVYANTKTG
jgi:hypothetical protein